MNEEVKTPEEIARQLVDDRDAYTKLYAGGEYGVDETALTRIIAAAIRDAYEHAASLIDVLVAKEESSVGQIIGTDVGKYGAFLLKEAAAHIRALKGEG